MNRQEKTIKEVLQALSQHFTTTRQAGHTTAMLDGVHRVYARGRVTILTCSADHAKMIKADLRGKTPVQVDAFCFSDLRALAGRSGPLLIDNAAIQVMCDLAVGTIISLEKELKEAKRRLAAIERLSTPKNPLALTMLANPLPAIAEDAE